MCIPAVLGGLSSRNIYRSWLFYTKTSSSSDVHAIAGRRDLAAFPLPLLHVVRCSVVIFGPAVLPITFSRTSHTTQRSSGSDS